MTTKKNVAKTTVRPAKSLSKKPVAAEPQQPLVEPASKRRPWYIALLAGGLVVLIVSAALAMTDTLSVTEQRIFNVINHAALPGWTAEQLAKPLSNAVWGMIGLVVVLLAVPTFRLRAWQYVVAGGATYVGGLIVEQIVDRARPFALPAYEVVARAVQDGHGFPSTHVAIITALGLTAWPYVNWWWRAVIGLLVGTEAWARIFLGVHAPLDVVAGAALAGVVVGAIHLTPLVVRKVFRVSA